MNFVEANGAKIPAIGLGTMTLMDAVCVEAVETALCVGYRHIDTAERYRNESEVGEGLRRGLRAAHVEREDVFVTTKVWRDQLAAADFERSLDQSLKKLELSWVDLLLVHWPNPKVPLKETLDVLSKAKRDGRAKHVGVANGDNVSALNRANAPHNSTRLSQNSQRHYPDEVFGIRDKPIAPASHWQNAFAERLIGSIRRECVGLVKRSCVEF
jgi:diketogulonate reductase-like aldo/keto reductase